MVTATIYSSAGTKVIDIGDTGLQPWLQETTYLMDQAGRTTATIAQTVAPTSMTGTGPFPTPFVTGPASSSATVSGSIPVVSEVRQSIVPPGQTSVSLTSIPTSASTPILSSGTISSSSTITTPPNPPSSSPSDSAASVLSAAENGAVTTPSSATAKPPMLNTIMGVAVGVLVGLVIGVAYYFYRRSKQRKARKEVSESGSENNWSENASPPAINYEKVAIAARGLGKIKAVFDIKSNDEKDEGWSQRWPQQDPKRLNDLDVHISHDEYAGRPPPPFDSNDPNRPPAAAPVSILKEPPVEPRTTLFETAHGLLKRAPSYEPNYAEKRPQVRKKGVRFGPDQVREFGLTPAASREASLDGMDTDSDAWSVDAMSGLESGSSNMSDREMEGEVLKKASAERSRR